MFVTVARQGRWYRRIKTELGGGSLRFKYKKRKVSTGYPPHKKHPKK